MRPPRKAAATKPRETQEGGVNPAPTNAKNVSGLGVGFDEPEIFIHFAGDGGEDVDGDGVFEVLGFLNGAAEGVGVVADVVDEGFDYIGAIVAERSASGMA